MKNLILYIILSLTTLSLFAQQKEENQGLHIDTDRTAMNDFENLMIKEINLVRTSPEDYIPFVEAYAEESKDKPEKVKEAKILIEFLKSAEPMAPLKPMNCLFIAGRNHAAEIAKTGRFNHKSVDGSASWDRIFSACEAMDVANPNIKTSYAQKAGSENIGTYNMGGSGGYATNDPRKVNIILLTGEFGRKNILNPNWEFVGTFTYNEKKEKYMEEYELNMYSVTYYWIQSFTRSQNND